MKVKAPPVSITAFSSNISLYTYDESVMFATRFIHIYIYYVALPQFDRSKSLCSCTDPVSVVLLYVYSRACCEIS